jgi:phosphatidylserine/phosphatidylglycerophosphate/cardiolipin synthase-like enzyme/protein tyrosine phosphatase (PTP) superfamily phosphohydrolase (DUF442 family)
MAIDGIQPQQPKTTGGTGQSKEAARLAALKAKFEQVFTKDLGTLELVVGHPLYPIQDYDEAVSPGLYRGAKLDPAQMQKLIEAGFHGFIDLRMEAEGANLALSNANRTQMKAAELGKMLDKLGLVKPLKSDPEEVKALGAKGVHAIQIPIVDNTAPKTAQMLAFLDFVTNPANQPAYVHCEAGKGRTGVAVAVYRMAVQGLTAEQAISDAKRHGFSLEDQVTFLQDFEVQLKKGDFAHHVRGDGTSSPYPVKPLVPFVPFPTSDRWTVPNLQGGAAPAARTATDGMSAPPVHSNWPRLEATEKWFAGTWVGRESIAGWKVVSELWPSEKSAAHPNAAAPAPRTSLSTLRARMNGQIARIADGIKEHVDKDQQTFRTGLEAIESYKGPPTFLRQAREWALDTPKKAFAALKKHEKDLPALSDAQLASFLSALDVNHLDKAKVPSGELLNGCVEVLTAHLSAADKTAVQDWLTKSAAAKTPADVGYPNLSIEGMGHVRAITTRMLNDGKILQMRLAGLDGTRFDHLRARRIQAGDVKGAQDYLRVVTGSKPSPGTLAKLMDDPGFELDPQAEARREPLLQQLRNWPKDKLDDPRVQAIAKQLWGAPLGSDGRPPRVGLKDASGKWFPFLDKNGPDGKLLPLPPGLLTLKPNAAYPNILADINTAIEQAQAVEAAAKKAGRPVADNERVPLWFHDYAFQSDGTGWVVAQMLVKAKKAGVDVRLQYDPQGSGKSNISIVAGKVVDLLTNQGIYKYMRDNGVPVLPFPIGKGSVADKEARDWLSHLKKDLVGTASYVGGAGNVGDEYSIQTMFHDMMTRITGPGTADTADGLAAYWNYSIAETTRREHRDHPKLQGAAFDAHMKQKYGDIKPISQEYLSAYRLRVAVPLPGAEMDPYNSVTQVDHWGGHQDENGKEAMSTLADTAQHRFVISAPYPTDPFFSQAAIRAEQNMKAYQDAQGVPQAQRQHATVILPAFNDVSLEYWEMLDKYEAMLRAGVEVYEYAGDPMLHSKFEVADDFWEHGSHNGDWRSRYGNNENLAYQHSKAGADAEDSHAQQLKQQSLQMTLDIVQARKHKIEEAIKAGVATAADKVVHL